MLTQQEPFASVRTLADAFEVPQEESSPGERSPLVSALIRIPGHLRKNRLSVPCACLFCGASRRAYCRRSFRGSILHKQEPQTDRPSEQEVS